ncbi:MULTISPECIES: DUF3618 domain-containing protein [Nocardiopsidaceae]|uniref:DUF3618 domain-containing protein n=1 Tax=Streptomonospora nanhaiensis TaxID=1323731 RepID=A0ABY6YF68_9ACTN|nr:DUF3618 domain-containing protein [Streptomonospora nanhaiensis]WAE70876.1 DUF3618 domain-containing protein [Streptomonospora nanhaiensis]
MGETSDRIRQDIERTRAELTEDTDRLVSRANPKNVIDRRTHRMRRRAHDMKERVMGSMPSPGSGGDSAGGSIRQNADQMAGAVRSAPQQALQQTQGNPLAAGLIAFGAGLLAASLLSESRAERQAAQQVQDRAGGMIEPVQRAVSESVDRVREQATESARGAGEHLKESASEKAHATGEQAQHEAKSASEEIRGS